MRNTTNLTEVLVYFVMMKQRTEMFVLLGLYSMWNLNIWIQIENDRI